MKFIRPYFPLEYLVILFVCGIFVALAFGVFHDTPLFRLMLGFQI